MKIKNLYLLLIAGALAVSVPAMAEEDGENLLGNAGFEEASANFMFGYSFEDWSISGVVSGLNTTDKLEGAQALESKEVTQVSNWVQQAVDVQNETAGEEYEVRVCYKVLSNPKGTSLRTDHYWDVYPLGRSSQDSAQLCDTLPDADTWQIVTVRTRMPEGAHYFHFRVSIGKGMQVLLDDFSFRRIASAAPEEPYIRVSPTSLSSVTTTIGNTVTFPAIHIEQSHVEGPTSFELSYTDADQFELSATSLAATESETDITVTYKPTKAGTHRAVLNIDNISHPTLFQSITLTGTCTDPNAKPTLTITPNTLPDFAAVAGEQQTQTILVKSENCTDYVYLSMSHVEGSAFIVGSSMLAKNYEAEVSITFRPQTAGTYRSVLTVYSENAVPVTLTLNGTATAATPETVGWATDFSWDESAPLSLLDERFDNVGHNQPLALSGWQNVAAADGRPWWGFDEAKTQPVRGDGRYAKATAYQYQKDSTGMWEMWLITPALDYKSAEGKIFAFSVMGEYLPEEGNQATLDVVYIDASDPNDVFYQVFDGLSIPKTADEGNTWIPFQINLEGQRYIDVFHMAFRYKGPNGDAGAVTYYIDDVSWGRTDLPAVGPDKDGTEQTPLSEPARKVLRNGQVMIIRGGKTYSILGITL